MSMYTELLSPIITMVLLYFFFKSNRMQRLRGFMNRLFLVDKFEGNSKNLLFAAKLFLIFYMFYILNFTTSSVLMLNFKMLLWVGLGAVLVPVAYQIVMYIQSLFYNKY